MRKFGAVLLELCKLSYSGWEQISYLLVLILTTLLLTGPPLADVWRMNRNEIALRLRAFKQNFMATQ
jgi:hypothetical protein